MPDTGSLDMFLLLEILCCMFQTILDHFPDHKAHRIKRRSLSYGGYFCI